METPSKVPCVFLVPLRYNDGREVEPEMLVQISQILNRQFGAYTKGVVVEGCWEDQTEESTRYMVCVPEDQVGAVQRVVLKIGAMLGQRAMFFAVGTGIKVQILDVEQSHG